MSDPGDRGSGLRSPAACNLFPDQMPLLGGQANPGEISAYLEHALCRASRLGIRKVVFASVSAWTAYGSCQDRRAEIVELVRGTVAPAFQKYQIRLLLEGLRRQVCLLSLDGCTVPVALIYTKT